MDGGNYKLKKITRVEFLHFPHACVEILHDTCDKCV